MVNFKNLSVSFLGTGTCRKANFGPHPDIPNNKDSRAFTTYVEDCSRVALDDYYKRKDVWLVWLVDHVTLDLWVMGSSPTLGV